MKRPKLLASPQAPRLLAELSSNFEVPRVVPARTRLLSLPTRWFGRTRCGRGHPEKVGKLAPIFPDDRASTRIELLAVLAMLAILLLLCLPLLANTTVRSQRAVCVNNLRQVAIGFRAWAMSHDSQFPWQVYTNNTIGANIRDAAMELSAPRILVCPSDDSRIAALSFSNLNSGANASYFINWGAREQQTCNWLTGDRNISAVGMVTTPSEMAWRYGTCHGTNGNLATVDGVVHQLSDAGLRQSATVTLSNQYLIFLLKP
jgi:type II secretory pathway pseudopilin PulG